MCYCNFSRMYEHSVCKYEFLKRRAVQTEICPSCDSTTVFVVRVQSTCLPALDLHGYAHSKLTYV